MVTTNSEGQLEFFDVTSPSTPPRPAARIPGRLTLEMRHDQLIVAGIASLIGLAVVFAFGVERGKQLVRGEQRGTERVTLAREPETPAQPAPKAAHAAAKSVSATESANASPAQPKTSPDSAERSKAVEPKKAAPARGRFAIQVVTYTQPQLAMREMQRLQQRGERAFLVKRDGRTMVYVGPFPSKDNAAEKLTTLKSLYQDCFLRSL